METSPSPLMDRPLFRGEGPRTWVFFIVLALFPFLMRAGLDLGALKQQALQGLYREWRYSPAGRQLNTGSEVIFESVSDRNIYEELFRVQLQREFKLVQSGADLPRVRAYLLEDRLVRGRIEVQRPGEGEPRVWEGERRLANNGLLLAPWVALLFYLLDARLWVILSSGLVAMLLWAAQWSPLHVVTQIWEGFSVSVQELALRIQKRDFDPHFLPSLANLSTWLWTLLALITWPLWGRRRLFGARTMLGYLCAALVVEAVLLWFSSRIGAWGEDARWWKVYLGSFAHRFFGLGVLALLLWRPRLLLEYGAELRTRAFKVQPLALLFPLAFMLAGGWEWLCAVLAASPDPTLLRLKCFFVGVLLGFAVGSRAMGLWLGALSLSTVIPPMLGHWNAAALHGLMMDGLLVGWWLTPLKGLSPILPLRLQRGRLTVVALVAWIVGVFLSSVDVPVIFCWALMGGVFWVYAQVVEAGRQNPDALGDGEALPLRAK